MPGYEERASILQGAGAMIFDMVCERATREQWSEWLRVPLEHAAGTGNADLVDKLLKAGADGSSGWMGCEGKSLLHAAAEGGNERVVSALTRTGAKEGLNSKALVERQTPLHLAILGGQLAAAEVLMLAGANVNVLNACNEGPLHLSIVGGHPGVAKDLLLRGADPNVSDVDGCFPIHLAARLGQHAAVRYLLHTGLQVDRLSTDGRTPLYIAAGQSHLSTVKVLLRGGADVAVLCHGRTPLHEAARRNNTDILAALVEAGADVEARNGGGCTPLHSSAYFGACKTMIALLRLGVNVHAEALATGSTPLHLACQEGRVDAVDLLLRWGADETALNKHGKTPSARMPNIAEAAEQDRSRLERLSTLLASAPQDRAWRRRGMLVLCRAHPDRLRLVVQIPDIAEASGQPQGRPSRRARDSRVKVEVTMGNAQNDGAGGASSSAGGGGRAAREGSGDGPGGGFDGVAAWLMALGEEDVFRRIMRFL